MDIKLDLYFKWSLTELFIVLILIAQFGTRGEGYWNWEPPPHHWPECPAEPANCKSIGSEDLLSRNYIIDGYSIKFSFPRLQNKLHIQCVDNATLNSESMPIFKNKTQFHSLLIESCDVPESYNRLLKTLNTTSVTNLKLIFQKQVTLAIQHFEDLKMSEMTIKGIEWVHIEEGVLESIKTLHSIQLEKVSLPPLLASNRIQFMDLLEGKSLGAFGSCGELKNLNIRNWQLKDDKIPEGWMSNCSKLRYLNLSNITVTEPPVDMFWNATELETILISSMALGKISSIHFRDTNKLKLLYLSNIKLKQIPRDMFTSLHVLKGLKFDYNPIGDLCDKNNGKGSVLGNIHTLSEISLRDTGATRICPEWKRELPSLLEINLSGNNIRKIQFGDINWLQRNKTRLDLRSNPLETIYYTEEEYKMLRNHTSIRIHDPSVITKQNLIFTMDSTLSCDCQSYWFALTIKDRPDHMFLPIKPKCGSNENFFDKNFRHTGENATCRLPRKECPTNCNCQKRVEFDSVEANCAGAALRQLPTIKHLEKLDAADNKIESIEELPKTLNFINLENNQISHLEEAAIRKLFDSDQRRIRIAGNPLLCRCEDLPLVRALQTHQKQVIDYDNVTCVNNQLISAIVLSDLCKLNLTTVTSSIFGSLTAIAVFISIGCYIYKREIQIYFFNKGWCLRWICEEELDCGKKYDAFVSYSHLDEEFVFKEIINELEKEENGFRICVHCRDWVVGEWIPAQIALSVDQSRRTIIVLSQNFLKSEWGRLEFRTAHVSAMKEGRARVVIVLLEDLDVLQDGLDAELRSYLANNTYVQWGDLQFHAKLRYALPYRHEERRARKAGEVVVGSRSIAA